MKLVWEQFIWVIWCYPENGAATWNSSRPQTSDILVSADTWKTWRPTLKFRTPAAPITQVLLTCGPSTTHSTGSPMPGPPSQPLPPNLCSQPSPAFPNSAEGLVLLYSGCYSPEAAGI